VATSHEFHSYQRRQYEKSRCTAPQFDAHSVIGPLPTESDRIKLTRPQFFKNIFSQYFDVLENVQSFFWSQILIEVW
jgi:hypothetical protein